VVTAREMYDGGMTGLMSLAGRRNLLMVVGEGWDAADSAKFPDATFLRLDHTGAHPEYDILDFESKYVTSPAVARRWARRHYALTGQPGTIYANPSNYKRLAPQLDGVPWEWWVTDQTGEPHAYQQAAGEKTPVATQWFGSRQGAAWKHLDRSLISDPSWPPGAPATAGGGGGGGSGGGTTTTTSSPPAVTGFPGVVESARQAVTSAPAAVSSALGTNGLGVAAVVVLVAVAAVWQSGKGKKATRKG
jgi:hypothetical protein